MSERISIESIKRLLTSSKSIDVLLQAFKEIIFKRKSYASLVVIAILSLAPASIIGISEDTIELFIKSVEILNGVILALFGVVFTGYAFFQALVNKELLKRLLSHIQKTKDKDGKNQIHKSKLEESNEYFVNVMMLDVFSIIANCFIIITVGSINADFSLPINHYANNTLAAFGIWVYFTFVLLIIWEMKSFVHNIFQLFNAHAGAKVLEILDEVGPGEQE